MIMKRILSTMALGALISFCPVPSALAAEYVSAAKDGVNLRSGADANASVLYQLPAGYPLEVLSKQGAWYKVSDYEGDKGWIQDSVVNKTPHVIVKVKECKVHNSPDGKAKVVGNGVKDVIFVKAEQKGDWIKVTHPSLTGWVRKDMVWP
jgi:SH3-like domain-containing protein